MVVVGGEEGEGAGLLIVVLSLIDAECVTRAGCECLQLLRVTVCVDKEHVVMMQQQLHVLHSRIPKR